jgi:alpha-1,3-mannosyltransferase
MAPITIMNSKEILDLWCNKKSLLLSFPRAYHFIILFRYPAGFVYIYTLFYALTSKGTNIRLAQYIFIAIYIIFISLVFFVYKNTKRVPPIALIFMCITSHRVHSIFVLRLFNDPIAMLFFYASISCFLMRWWRVGCILFW